MASKISIRKISVIFIVIAVLTIATERLVAFKYDVQEYIAAFRTIFQATNSEVPIDNFELIDYEKKKDYIQSMSNDGQLILSNLNQKSQGITIFLAKPCAQDKSIVLYYTDKNDASQAFTEEKSYSKTLVAGETEYFMDFPACWIKDLRIDLGNNAGDIFYIDSIKIKQSFFWSQFGNSVSRMRMIILLAIYCFIGLHFAIDVKKLYQYIYRYRYVLAGVVIILTVTFSLNGSSISMWNTYLPGTNDSANTEPLFGVARAIRSDEWATQTPFAISQQYTSFQYFNDVIRATPTDVEVVYGQPLNSALNLFRPYYWGYNFLSLERGLSFYWITKLLLLFFTSFEVGMIISHKNKIISALLAICITFSPGIQWWFSILAVPDVLIFGQLAILSFYYMIVKNSVIDKFFYACLLAIAGGGYILVIYPPTQVAAGYVFAVLMLWILISKYKQFSDQKKYNIMGIAGAFIAIVGMIVFVVINSAETIKSVQNTEYPGQRIILGGSIDNIKLLFRYIGNIFFSFNSDNVPANVCESASMFDFFPIGIILAILVLRKGKDMLLGMLMGIDIWLICWMLFPFPAWFARISLLSNVQPGRCVLVVGYVNLLLIARVLSRTSAIQYKRSHRCATAILSALLCAAVAKQYYTTYLSNSRLVICIFLLIACFLIILFFDKSACKRIAMIGCPILMLVIGGTINPIQRGATVITENELITAIHNVVANSSFSTRWLVVGEYPMINAPIMAGAPTINSTNVYPQLELWEKIDSDRKFENIYNRYAHIAVDISNDATKFELNSPDMFTIYLNNDDLSTLNITHILSDCELNAWDNELKLLDMIDNYYIYEVVGQ